MRTMRCWGLRKNPNRYTLGKPKVYWPKLKTLRTTSISISSSPSPPEEWTTGTSPGTRSASCASGARTSWLASGSPPGTTSLTASTASATCLPRNVLPAPPRSAVTLPTFQSSLQWIRLCCCDPERRCRYPHQWGFASAGWPVWSLSGLYKNFCTDSNRTWWEGEEMAKDKPRKCWYRSW